MDKDRIIHQSDTAKFQVEINHPDYDQQTDPFYVVLSWGIPEQVLTIDRSDMVTDEEGHFFMSVSTAAMLGRIKAECHYTVPDSDYAEGTRDKVDIQFLAFVTDQPCPRIAGCCGCTAEEDAHVRYTRIWRNDANTLYLNLRDSEKRPLRDSDGNQLRVRKEPKDLN